jgi:hypothetical protein
MKCQQSEMQVHVWATYGKKQSGGVATDTRWWSQDTWGKRRMNRKQNYGSNSLQGYENKIIKMRTTLLIMLHGANSARFDIPMEVNMNRTVFLDVTPCSVVYTTTLKTETLVY